MMTLFLDEMAFTEDPVYRSYSECTICAAVVLLIDPVEQLW